MSIILMTHHDENIYDIFKSQTEAKKQIKLRYKTEKDQVKVHRPEVIVPKKKYAIMGVANLELPDPHNFLKKGSGRYINVNKSTKIFFLLKKYKIKALDIIIHI